MIVAIAMTWSWAKVSLEHGIGIESDLLHAYVGVLILVGAQLLIRRPTLWMPWLIVLGAECLNEMLDMSRPVGAVESDLSSSLHDLFNTMFLPTILLLCWNRMIAGHQRTTGVVACPTDNAAQ